FRRLDGGASTGRSTLAAVALAVTAPLYWFTAVRPLSDMPGLAAAVAAQAGTIAAATTRQMAAAAFAAGLASGLRSQVVWLTVPLLAVKTFESRRFLLPAAIAWTGGVLAWLVPLVVVTGGPAAYWRALFNQGAE